MLKMNPNYDKKLRIAFIGARGLPHTYGGYEAVFLEMAPRLVARGHEVIVYNHKKLFRERPPFYRGVRLIYLPAIETKNLGTPTHTLMCAFDVLFRSVDVIFCVNVANAMHMILPRLFGKPVACNVDGLEWLRGKWGRLARNYFYLNARLVGRICQRGVITDAEEMRRIYREQFHTRSVFIANGANVESSVNSDVVRRYGLTPGEYYLIASRMIPENNADLIISAFNRLQTNKVLAIAGSANYRSEFVTKLQNIAGPRVKFLGHVGNSEHVKELHCNCYAYVHGHMLGGINPALLKALGCGNMVLALNTPFNREVLLDHYGCFFELDENNLLQKMQFIEDRPEIAAQYRVRAPQRIREAYTWDHITDQYEELFLQLAADEDPTRIHSTVLSEAQTPPLVRD